MATVDRLSAIAREIDQHAKVLTDKLRAKGLEAPSFDVGGLAEFALDELDAEARDAKQNILALSKELHDLVEGPREFVKNQAISVVNYVALHAVYAFRLAEAVPRSGSISYNDLVGEVQKLSGTELPSSILRRLLRLAMSSNMFHEPTPGHVAHNRASLLMVDDECLANWVGLFTDELFVPVGSTVCALQKWPAAEESNQTAVNVAYGHDYSFFKHLAADPVRAKRYDLAMRAHGSREGFDLSHTVNGYPWEKLGVATVVDIGGNEGYVSAAVADKFPLLSFTVQDLPGMRTDAVLAKVAKHSRVTLTTHDMFDAQPVVADAYFFRHVFHAFPDKDVVRALHALIPTLRPGARVIINDAVLPAPGTIPAADERMLRILDVLMTTVCNGREREVDDWKDIFAQADARFVWKGACKSTGKLSFIEAVWE